ncbi:pantoate--beta-alanine ligase [Actinomarinicola tropica]|uniref:Pantothenate synthetase n=1 Tax=Actinomarinicola tropica TaxID=2789776 RepID=A0A5Q2RLY9_9ACTN|nr:pantoate--beta-alanine ligase [Actinomarinicola tropica]QGG96494.1 pantoate--beta-alanine ligase [Actinomarinicola tropica]
MIELTTVAELRAHLDAARARGRSVGFVPTMGYLHEGHASLVRAAARDADDVVVSIFVNPLQFAPHEDLDAYPRDLDRDRQLAADAGATVLFVPGVEEMYPEPVATTVSVAGVSAPLEGESRPTHFAGVATVVAKLFNIVGPCRAYFGEKDFQQVAVVRRMAADLSFPVEVVAEPTVREDDGLAMSSRNAYLDDAHRTAAPALHRALAAGAEAIAGGSSPDEARAAMHAVLAAEPLAEVDYLDVVDPTSLESLQSFEAHRGRAVRLVGAARIGQPRLIDNIGATVPAAAD